MTMSLSPSTALQLDDRVRFGFITGSTSPAGARRNVELAESAGYDSLWTGDHIAFPLPIHDPFVQLAQYAVLSDRLLLGTSVYLLPLRHPTVVAKQVASMDHLSDGRFIFGVGQGGEFPKEYEACSVPLEERGSRMSEALRILPRLWTGEEVSHSGKHFSFDSVCMRPATTRPGGPPIWCGARSEPALRRTGRLAGGYVSYAVTPSMFADALRVIEQAAESAGRLTAGLPFGTGHLLFAWIEDDPEVALDKATDHLSRRYAMDFRKAARKYAALGRPEDVAERVQAYLDQGVRHIIVDATGPGAERESQLERFGKEVIPLLRPAAA